jgi:hypothetical protein
MIGRYVRAFFTALRMTLRGESAAPPLKHPELHEWSRQTIGLLDAVQSAAERSGLLQGKPEQRTVIIDKRSMSLEAALQVIRHHAAREYPYLLKHYTPDSLLAIQATNLNDRYLALRLQEMDGLSLEMQALLGRLNDHLNSIPAVKDHAT